MSSISRPHSTHSLYTSPAARRPADVQLLTTDKGVQMSVNSAGQVGVFAGMGGRILCRGGQVGLLVNGAKFIVDTYSGLSMREALKSLRLMIEGAGYDVIVTPLPTIDSLAQRWTISLL